MARLTMIGVIALWFVGAAWGQGREPLLLQTPTLNKTQIAFVYGGEIWSVGREAEGFLIRFILRTLRYWLIRGIMTEMRTFTWWRRAGASRVG